MALTLRTPCSGQSGPHLAIALVAGGFASASVDLRQFVTRELDFAEKAVVFNLKALVFSVVPPGGVA